MSEYISHSTLELFPDELFFELFEYIPSTDLYRSFVGLNRRIDSILRHLPNIIVNWITKSDDHLVNFFAPYTTRLVIWRAGHFDLARFSRLISLKLALPTREQCDQIQPSSNLEHIHIDRTTHGGWYSEKLPSRVFTHGFPRLHSFHLNEIKFDPTNNELIQWTQVSSLRSLSIQTDDPARLLSLCPMLFHLRLNLKTNIIENFQTIPHLHLRRLHLGIYSSQVNLSTIESILILTPNLTCLTIDSPCIPSAQNKINVNSLAPVFKRCLPKLRRIQIRLTLDDSVACETSPETIQRLHTLFNYVNFRPKSTYESARLIISS